MQDHKTDASNTVSTTVEGPEDSADEGRPVEAVDLEDVAGGLESEDTFPVARNASPTMFARARGASIRVV